MTIDELLRQATRDVRDATIGLEERQTPRPGMRPAWVTVAATAVVALVAIGVPILLVTGDRSDGTEVGSAESATSTTVAVDDEIPTVVLDYWALEGTLESVGEEPGWLCPPQPSVGNTSIVAEEEIPASLEFTLPDLNPVEVYNRNDGPTCHQPPMLVLVATTDPGSELTSTTAGVAVWPRTTRFEDTCGEGCSFDGGPVETPTINGQPARIQLHTQTGHYDAWWVDTSGTPLYAETSGLGYEEVVALIDTIALDPETHRVILDRETAGVDFEIVLDQPSVGVWERGYWRAAEYQIGGTSILITATRDVSFDPYARFAAYVDDLIVTDVEDGPAVWVPEAGNFLVYETPDGVKISIEGAPTIGEAIAIARQLG